MNIKFRHLSGFIAAAKRASFSSAAGELAMTQPAFSQLIRELESTLRVKLFNRTTRRIELTDAGRRFFAMVERPLDDLRDAYEFASEIAAGRRGRMVFASLHSIAFGPVIEALARFKIRYPAIDVRLVESNNSTLIDRVLHREVDFAIGTLPVAHRDLTFRSLLSDEVLLVCPSGHRFSGRRQVTWREIAQEPLVLMPKGSSARELVERGFATSHVTLEAEYEVVNMVTALSMVRARLALTIISRLALLELNRKGLTSVQIGAPRPLRRIGVIARQDRPLSAVAQAYVDLLFASSEGRSKGVIQA